MTLIAESIAQSPQADSVSQSLALELGLTADEYDRIIQLLGRVPTYEELACSASCGANTVRTRIRS